MVQFKNRYMVMEVFLDSNRDSAGKDLIRITQYNVSKAIKDSIQANFGECGLAISLGSFQVKYVNDETKLCIIRTSRDDHQKVWSAITMVRSIGNCPVTFNLLDLSAHYVGLQAGHEGLPFHVLEFYAESGSIKCCKSAALKCEEAKFEQLRLVRGDSLTSNAMESSYDKIKSLDN